MIAPQYWFFHVLMNLMLSLHLLQSPTHKAQHIRFMYVKEDSTLVCSLVHTHLLYLM